MTRFPLYLLLPFLFAAVPVHAVGLPDTGQDICYNDTAADGVAASSPASIARDAGTHPGQDCRYGRDAAAAAGALAKSGAGASGFDYTKIANNGSTLAASATAGAAATDWACTRDNVTGLTWEVKTAGATDPRSANHRYTWYNSDDASNGGNAGNTGTNTCKATLPGNLCNTQAFVRAVNTAALCTYTDWRMPTMRELETLLNLDGSSPSIAPAFFADTQASYYWSASAHAQSPANAWNVNFYDGFSLYAAKTNNSYVRLVRGGPF
jgi:hypothetical protein